MQDEEYHKMYEAEDEHWWYSALHTLIMNSLPQSAGLRLLDAGCGTGRLLQLAEKRGFDVSGCDISERSLAYCRLRGLNQVAQMNLNSCGLEPCGYDVITAIDVLYHQWISDDRRVLTECYKALKPGGILILQVPAYEWLRSVHDKAVLTGRRYTRPRVTALLKDCGFVIEKASYRVSLLFLPIALIRLARRRLHDDRPESDVRNHAPAVNALLKGIMKIENVLLRFCSFPFGTSLYAVARKPEDGRR